MKVSLKWYWIALVGSVSLLAIAYFYFQQSQGLFPCPLCMLQRACLVGVAIVSLLGILKRPGVKLHRFYAGLISICSIAGAGIAGRQVWLQHLPADQVPECGFDPIYRWGQDGDYGLFDMIGTTLHGSGDCAVVDWSLWGLSMGGWMLVIFSIMSLIALSLTFRSQSKLVL
ncbi:MAG: disulfide bond formation protein B [Arenicella sp.]